MIPRLTVFLSLFILPNVSSFPISFHSTIIDTDTHPQWYDEHHHHLLSQQPSQQHHKQGFLIQLKDQYDITQKQMVEHKLGVSGIM